MTANAGTGWSPENGYEWPPKPEVINPNGLGQAFEAAGNMIDDATGASFQGPIQKTYLDAKGQARYVGTGKLVPAGVARAIAARRAKLAAAQRKSGKVQAKAKAKGVVPARGGAAGGGGSSASEINPNPSSGLGSFGKPDDRNVSRIVNAIIADATRQHSWANTDARRQTQGELRNIAEGALATDQIQQTGMAATKLFQDELLTRNAAAAAAEQAANAQYRQTLESTGGGGIPEEYAVTNADMAGGVAGANTFAEQTGAANNAFYQMTRAANAMSAQEAGRNARSNYNNTVFENNRAIAAEKAKRALYEQQVRKDLMDQHIAQRMAEAEWAQRGSNLQNDQVSRQTASQAAAAQQAQLQTAKAERDWKISEVLNSIIMGTPTPYESIEGADKDGKPIIVKQIAPMGQASTWQEAVRRIRLAGLGSHVPQAQSLWQEVQRQRLQSGVQGGLDAAGNMISGWGTLGRAPGVS